MFVRDHFESCQCIPEHRRLLQALRKKHGKEKARAPLIKYHKFWRCPKARIKALL
jgi:sulfur relay (sulfurtransferase) DsrC/TusE family protein